VPNVNRLMISLILSAGALMLAGCVNTTKGMIRSSEDDGQGRLVSDCRNVSESARIEAYDTRSYHTTYSSAWKEGAAAGLASSETDNLGILPAMRKTLLQPDESPEKIFESMPGAGRPYCRVFARSDREVAEAVDWVLKRYPFQVGAAHVDRGLFITALMSRQHDMTGIKFGIGARWKEGLVVTVSEERSSRTVLRVLRRVYIARDDSGFYQAETSGNNEIAFITAVATRLTRTPRYRPLILVGSLNERSIQTIDEPDPRIAGGRPISGQAWTTPPIGSPERRAVIYAIRPGFAQRLSGSIQFRVTELRVGDRHAFISVVPLKADGTPHRDQQAGGRAASGNAVLERSDKGWRILHISYDAMDRGYCTEASGVEASLLPGCS